MAQKGRKSQKRSRELNEAQKMFIVQHLACFNGPQETADAFKAEYGFEVSAQRVEAYNPTRRAGRKLSEKWREVFEATRKRFLSHVEDFVPEANKAVRVQHLVNAARAFKSRGNYVAMADMLERIAKELGNVHTNRREISGRDGKPIEFADLTEEQLDARLATMLGQIGVEVENPGQEQKDDGSSSTVH